jgi:putative membrane protein
MFYYGYHFWGMHVLWWFVWLFFIFWIFGTPYDIPDQQNKRNSPFDILKKRFAAGQISREQYEQDKIILEEDMKK